MTGKGPRQQKNLDDYELPSSERCHFRGTAPYDTAILSKGNTETNLGEDLSQLQSFGERLHLLLPEGINSIENHDPRWYPPWQTTCPVRVVIPQRSKEAEKRIHLNRLKAIWKNPSINVFYTDGSHGKRTDGTLQNSAAFCKLNSLGIDKTSSMNLGTRVEIADVEVIAICNALEEDRKSTNHKTTYIFVAHGDYSWYHNKFDHHDAEIHCTCTSFSEGRIEKGPEHFVHCTKTNALTHLWPKPPKPGKKRDGSEWPEDSLPMRLHNLELDQPGVRHAYWRWLVRNPLTFGKFCEATNYFDKICPAFQPKGEWCCTERDAERRRRAAAEEESSDEELEIVAANALA
ncbi:hypothetical protein F5Y17DRAFT_463462 [Xylariaceae sp. FL0594]|nr:hypothetical protein F5Y17DRAFT_463462 [Xylariaceae sp. FL0594]